MQQTVGAQESRAIAEAARETEWRKPSFAKELFLGRLRLDLIHPHPRPPRTTKKRARSSWTGCGHSSRRRSMPRRSNARRGYPTSSSRG